MKTRLFVFVARCFLIYQLVKFVKTLTRVMRSVVEQRAGLRPNYGPPRTTYRR